MRLRCSASARCLAVAVGFGFSFGRFAAWAREPPFVLGFTAGSVDFDLAARFGFVALFGFAAGLGLSADLRDTFASPLPADSAAAA